MWASYHTLVHYNNGSIYGFGDNTFGQLGLRHININNCGCDNYNKPTLLWSNVNTNTVVCNRNMTFIYTNDGNLYVCGYNKFGLCDNKKCIEAPTLLLCKPNIKSINGIEISEINWKKELYASIGSKNIKNIIYVFIIIHHIYCIKKGFTIGKDCLYYIISLALYK